MAFSEQTKLKVKRRSHFKCCICQRLDVEVHHIVPQAEGGDDTEENAAPLCRLCHDRYGGNPQKRKFIRQKRDHWYDICDKMYAPFGYDKIEEIATGLKQVATKEDIKRVMNKITEFHNHIINQSDRTPEEIVQVISDISTSVSSEVVSCEPSYAPIYQCPFCGGKMKQMHWDNGVCPHCGHPCRDTGY